MSNPLLLPAIALACGIVLARLGWLESADIGWALPALAALSALARRRAPLASRIAGLLAVSVAGAWLEIRHQPALEPFIDADPYETVLLEGCVVEPPVKEPGRIRFTLEAAPKARARVSVYLNESETPPPLRYGQRVDVEGRIRPVRNFQNPGAFDYESYMARQQTYWTVSASGAEAVRLLAGRCGSPFKEFLYRAREVARDRLERGFSGDSRAAAMLAAVLLGDRDAVAGVWKDQFRRTGTYHTLVISGLHLTVLAALFLFVCRMLNLGPGWTLGVTAALGWMYALFTGWHTSVVRAASGLTLYLVGTYFYRRRRLLNILAAIAVAFLVLDPDQLFDASFQLSFLSVAMIGAVAIPLIQHTSHPYETGLRSLADAGRDLHLVPKVAQFRIELRLMAETLACWSRLPQRAWLWSLAGLLRLAFYIYELALVSAVIQLGLALPMVVYFHQVSLTGFLANPLVVPLMSGAVITGALALLMGTTMLGWLPAIFVHGAQRVVNFFASLEPHWRVPDPPAWLVIAFLATLLALALAIPHQKRLWLPAAIFLGMLLVLLVWYPFPPQLDEGKLELTAIDVGQGDSLLLKLPGNQLILIDGGGIPSFGGSRSSNLDIGEDVVSPYLWSRGIRRLDVVVSTHSHEDHLGGLTAVLRNFRPAELWTTRLARGPGWQQLASEAARLGVKVRMLGAEQEWSWAGTRFRILAPLETFVERPAPHNNDSLVIEVSYGQQRFLLTGDAEQDVELALAQRGRLRRIDVLKVAHHGSRNSTPREFLAATQPAFALISAGYANTYRFPHTQLLDRLAAFRVTVFRTDLHGAITIKGDGRQLEVEAWRWPVPRQPRFRPPALL